MLCDLSIYSNTVMLEIYCRDDMIGGGGGSKH